MTRYLPVLGPLILVILAVVLLDGQPDFVQQEPLESDRTILSTNASRPLRLDEGSAAEAHRVSATNSSDDLLRLEAAQATGGQAILIIRVRDDLGNPLSEATVHVASLVRPPEEQSPPQPRTWEADTNTLGVATIPNADPGEAWLTAQLEGYTQEAFMDFNTVQLLDGVNRLDLNMLRGGSLTGRVMDEFGASVAGAEVELLAGRRKQSGKTREDGTVHFDAVPAGSVSLSTKGKVSKGVRSRVEPGRETTVDLRVSPGAWIVGRLHDEGSKKRRWGVGAMTQLTESYSYLRAYKVDDEGAFRIGPLAPGTYRVVAGGYEANGMRQWGGLYGIRLASNFVTVAEGSTAEVELNYVETTRVQLSGHVTVNGRLLKIQESERWSITALHADVAVGYKGDFEERRLRNGTFDFILPSPGTWAFQLRLGSALVGEAVHVVPDRLVAVVVLDFDVCRVSGRVSGPGSGQGIWVGATRSAGTLDHAQLHKAFRRGRRTELVDGEWSLLLPSRGRWTIAAMSLQPWFLNAISVDLSDGEDREGLSIEVPQLSLSSYTHVQVSSADGWPTSGAVLRFRRGSVSMSYPPSMSPVRPDGRALVTLPPGEWWVSACLDNKVSPERGPFEAGAKIELQLQAGGGLDIHTFDKRGTPVAADVRVFDASGREVLQGFSPRGFGLPHVTTAWPVLPGTYTVRATGPGGSKVERRVSIDTTFARLDLTLK